MKHPATVFAGLTLVASLFLGACSTATVADSTTSAVTTSSRTGASAELN